MNVIFRLVVFPAAAATFVAATAGAVKGDPQEPDPVDSAIDAADEDPALEYYERKLKGQKDGVYEFGNDILLMCSLRFDTQSADSRNNAQRKTKEIAISKIKDWCVSHNASNKVEPANDKQRFLWMCLDEMVPGWRYPEWRFAGSVRIIVRDEDYEAATFTTVVAVSKKAVERAAEKFVPHVSDNDVKQCIVNYYSRSECAKFGIVGKNVVVSDEKKIKKKISAYLAESELATQLRQETMCRPKITVATNDTCTLVSTTVSIPRMQQMFLSGATLSQGISKRTSMGLQAEKTAYADGESLDKKKKVLKDALCENPSDYGLWNLYGRLLQESGDQVGALIAFMNALKIKPDYAYALVNSSKIYGLWGLLNLEVVTAIKARGCAKDKWSVTEAEKILFAP